MILKDMKDCKWNGNDVKKLIWNNNILWEKKNEEWEKLSDLPRSFDCGCAVVLDDEIHILQGKGDVRMHYKLNKNANRWENVSRIYDFNNGCALVINGEIHIMGGEPYYSNYDYYTLHRKMNNDTKTWSDVSTLPAYLYDGAAVYINNEIHIINKWGEHYKYNLNTGIWTQLSRIPNPNFQKGTAVVFENKIHVIGGDASTNLEYPNHYMYDPNTNIWSSLYIIPYDDMYGGASVVANDEIHIMCYSEQNTKHYKWNKNLDSWEIVSELPYEFKYGSSVFYKGAIHIIGGGGNYFTGTKNHYKLEL